MRETLDSLGVDGAVAVVTAGWQEREGEDHELRAHLGCDVVDLLLYHRFDDVLLRDRELAAALDRKGQLLRRQQELYTLRLGNALDSARDVMSMAGKDGPLNDHRRGALRVLRSMDRLHVRRVGRIQDELVREWNPVQRPAVARHREQLAEILGTVCALCIAGGHVATLINRLRLFDLLPLLEGKPVVAWSAGAMVASERVVLFHDSPPQGRGNPEVLDAGLGLCPGVLPLPHASRRLQLDDPVRVGLFARRFSPSICAILDAGTRMDWDGSVWTSAPGTRRMTRTGRIREISNA